MARSVTESEYAQGVADLQAIITAFKPNTDCHPEPFNDRFVDDTWFKRLRSFFSGLPKPSSMVLSGKDWNTERERYHGKVNVCNVEVGFFAPSGGEMEFYPKPFHPQRGCRDVDLKRLAKLREQLPAWFAQEAA